MRKFCIERFGVQTADTFYIISLQNMEHSIIHFFVKLAAVLVFSGIFGYLSTKKQKKYKEAGYVPNSYKVHTVVLMWSVMII